MSKKVVKKSKDGTKSRLDGKKIGIFSAFFRKQIREVRNIKASNSATKVKKR
jgi:hypothetical protein